MVYYSCEIGISLLLEANDITKQYGGPWNRYIGDWLSKAAESDDFDTLGILLAAFPSEEIADNSIYLMFPHQPDDNSSDIGAKKCADRIAKMYIESGIEINLEKLKERNSLGNFNAVGFNLCLDTVKLLANKHPEQMGRVTLGFEDRIKREVEKAEQETLPKFWNAETQGKILDFGDLLTTHTKKYCNNGSLNCRYQKIVETTLVSYTSRASQVEKYFKSEELRRDNDARIAQEKADFADSEEGRLQKICQLVQLQRGAEESIACQKKIGQKTGVVNKQILYEAGNRASAAEEWIASHSKGFQEKFGKSPDLKKCK